LDKPEIIFVHNLLDLENEDDVTEVINTEIYGILGAKLVTISQRREKQNKNIDTYRSIYNGTTLLHFIMAKDGSPAGKKWNNQSLNGIVAILQADIRRRRNVRVLEETLSYVNNKLPQLFSCSNDSKTDLSKLQIVKHARESYIVLSDLKDVPLGERQKHSSLFSVSPRLIYDQRGFLMGIFSETIGKWEPRYRVYENSDCIKVFVELAGFRDTDVVVNVDKNNIFIKGKRDDFEELQYKKLPDQSELPIGPFELKIPVQCEIEDAQAKLDCKDGLFVITCPKMKMTVHQLGAQFDLKK
jgi:HSP20 family molecular chaperone IbpA